MSSTLNILDWLFVAIFFFSVLFGLLRGLVRELLALGFLIAALVVGYMYYQEVGLLFSGLLKKRELANFAGFLLLLLLVSGAGSIITRLLGKYLVIGPLKAFDRMLGGIFGLIRAGLLSAMIVYSFLAFPLNETLLKRSQFAPVLIRGMVAAIKILPPGLQNKMKLIKIYDYQKTHRDSRTI